MYLTAAQLHAQINKMLPIYGKHNRFLHYKVSARDHIPGTCLRTGSLHTKLQSEHVHALECRCARSPCSTPTRGHGAHIRHLPRACTCASWQPFTAKAFPDHESPHRTLSCTRAIPAHAPKTLIVFSFMHYRIGRNWRSHFGAFNMYTRVSVSPKHATAVLCQCQTRFCSTLRVLRISLKFQSH